MTRSASPTQERTISNCPSGLEESEMSASELLEGFGPFQASRAWNPFLAVPPAQRDIVISHLKEGPQTISYSDINSGVVIVAEAVMPRVVTGGSAVLGAQAADVWLSGAAIKALPANEDLLIWPARRLNAYETLAREFGIRTAFLESAARHIAAYVRQHAHLSLSLERLVDREVGRAVQVCFEVHGTRSSEETTQVWNDLGTALDGVAASQDDRNALIEKIGVHVHRGSV